MGEVARALQVNPNVLYRWRREFRQGPVDLFPGSWEPTLVGRPNRRQDRKIGQQAPEIDFLKGCLPRIEELPMRQAVTGNPRSIGRSKKKRRPIAH